MQAAPSLAPQSQSASSSYLRVVVCALVLTTAHAGLLVLGNLSDHVTITLLLVALGFGALFIAGRQRTAPSWVVILGVAAVLRILLLPIAPTLSDDVLRYVWDGRVVAAGENPYLLAPDAPELAPLRDDLWRRLPHREVPTVYPPLALGLFSIASRVPAPILAWKVGLAILDLGTCALLLLIAGKCAVPSSRVLWYAWNPLVILETAGMGHVDALGVAAVVATVWFLLPGRRHPTSASGWAGAAAAAGVLAKLVPVVAVPMWGLRSRSRWRFFAVAAVVLMTFAVPMLLANGGVPEGLTTYGVSWEFNGPFYEPLWRLIDGLGVDRLLHDGLDRLKQASGWHAGLNRLYPYVYPRFLAKLLLLGVLAGVVALSLRSRGVPGSRGVLEATLWVLGAALLCSATFYPWYLLWVLPFAALTCHRAWLLLSVLLPLSYLPQCTEMSLFPWIYLAIWGPFALLGLWSWRSARPLAAR